MSGYPIPDAALDDRLAIVGTAGAGKTYAAMTAVERLLDRGARVVVPDPLGVWFGLRLTADGASLAYPVVVVGGPHADLPVNEHAGALIGETIARASQSFILDLSELGTKAAERRFMLAMLTALYRQASGEPVHLVFDEADMWAPQKLLDKDGDAAKLLGQMETIVRRGRVKGFIPWLITQRPAVLSKDVLSQVDGLIAMKLTSTQDRKALGAWIEGQADVAQGNAIDAALPAFQRGQGVVWMPARGILETVQFPTKKTFDSSRTPKRGETKRNVVLKPVDIEALRGRLAIVESEIAANDPKRLKARIAELEREATKVKPAVIDEDAIAAAYSEGVDTGFKSGMDSGIAAERQRLGQKVLDFAGQFALATQEVSELPKPPAQVKPFPVGTKVSINGKPHKIIAQAKSDSAMGAERKPLAILARVYPGGYTEAQWAAQAGFKRSGGTWGTYKSRLRMAGRIEQRGDLWYATEQGAAETGEVSDMPEAGPELVAWWGQRIGSERKILEHLSGLYPHGLDKAELADALEMTASGGTFGTYLSRLRSNGLIEESDRGFRVSPNLMGFDA